MSYDDERPADWSTYDRVATAAADMRFLMFEMRAGVHMSGSLMFSRRIGDTKPSREDLLLAMGPHNYESAREYLDCIAINVKKMGTIALSFAAIAMAQSTDPTVAPILERLRTLMAKDEINGAWNLVEAWACGRALPTDDADADDDNDEAKAPEEVV